MNKKKLIMEMGSKCLACDTTENLCIDHIKAKKLGGKDHRSNYQVLCRPCNTMKGQQTIEFDKGVPNWVHIRLATKCPGCRSGIVLFRISKGFICRRCGKEWTPPKERPLC